VAVKLFPAPVLTPYFDFSAPFHITKCICSHLSVCKHYGTVLSGLL